MPDYSWAERDDWESAWQSLVDVIGTEFGDGVLTQSTEDIEKGLIRRYLEPLEFDCPLHYDEKVAREHGHPGIIAPYSGLATWLTTFGVWSPGDEPVYLSGGRNDVPRYRGAPFERPGPDTNSVFATDVEYEYHRPFVVGDRLSVGGRKLLSVLPKQTSVGRGVFMTTESNVINQNGDLIATQRMTAYIYVAHQKS
jgi:acyl dehydratase